MRARSLLVLALVGAACHSVAPAPVPARPLNVILVLTDDQGWGDLGLLGTPGLRTPNLDRLAAEGTRLSHFYVAQPVCSASRAAYMTGCYPQRVGIHGALSPKSEIALALEETTIAELLKERGRTTAMLGKWHLGQTPEFLPTRQGFDRYCGVPYSHDMWPGHPESPKIWGDIPLYEQEEPIAWNTDPSLYTGIFNDRAEAFVREMAAADQPFFLYLAHPLPHVPLGAGPDFAGSTGAGLYADTLAEIDDGIGRLLNALEETGLDDDTLLVFTSDNGPWLSYGDHAGTTGGLREGKGTTFEGGVRVPFLARWPGVIPAGRVVDTPAMSIDVLPTIAELCGTRLPERPIDGASIAGLLLGTDERPPHEALFFTYHDNNLEGVRAGRWKLHFPHGYRTMNGREPGHGGKPGQYDYGAKIGLELYDLVGDRSELRDVAAEHPDVVARLTALADAHRARLGDRLTKVEGTENREPGHVTLPDRWNQFRGPNGTGIAAGGTYPAEIGPDRNVVWASAVPPGHSSPVVDREHVYLTGLEGESLVVFALDRKSGERVWTRELPRARHTTFHPDNHPAAASVAVDGNTLVAFFDEFGLAAYTPDGTERWRLPLGPFDNVYGMGASPVIAGNVVVQACDQQTGSFVIGVDRNTGKERWRVARPLAISGHCTPAVHRTATGVNEVLLPGSYLLDAYDARNGERRWWLAGLPSEMKSVPVLLGNRLWLHGYSSPLNDLGNLIELPGWSTVLEEDDADHDERIGPSELREKRLERYFVFYDLDGDGSLDETEWDGLRLNLAAVNAAMAVTVDGEPGERAASTVVWRHHRAVPQLPSPLVYGGVYWMLADQGGLLTMLDPDTGEELAKERLPEALGYYASPVGGDGKVYLLSKDGVLTVLRAGRTFEPLHRAEFGETCYATPALEDDFVWLRTETKLYCFTNDGAAAR
jgi:arylsulfatase A-like enzyme